MFSLLAAVALFALVGATPTGSPQPEPKIVGGEDVTISAAPYQASLVFRGRHSCGATIVSNDLLVTAAHCIMGSNPSDYQVRVGSSSSLYGGELYPVGDLVWHKDFNYFRMDSDIAVVWLSKPMVFGETVAAIDMQEPDDEVPEGTESVVTGWGHTKEGGGIFPTTLQMVKVPIVSEEDCKKMYAPNYAITPNMLCAGLPSGGKDACQGDSGGPLVVDNRLAGVVSWGLGCARPRYPGVYARVAALRPWLEDAISYLRLKHVFRAVR